MTAIDERFTAKGFTPAPPGRTLDDIVIHHWGTPGQSHDDVVDFFVNGPGETSAHFVVSAGRITCLVTPADVAWHAGSWTENLRSIGIECRPEATPQDYAAVAELVAWLRQTYNRPFPLTPHRQYYATACPGVWDLPRLNALAIARTAKPSPPKGPFMALTDAQQTQLLNDVAFIKSELENINTSAGPVRFRDFFVQGVRAAQQARDAILKK